MHCSPEPVALKPLADDTLVLLEQTAAQKEICLSNSLTPDCWVQADRLMLETIIRNLVGNALKFTPRRGQVTLGSQNVDSQNGAGGQPGFVKVSVRDTGVGMSPEDVARLFRIDDSHSRPGTEKEPGSGLGLIICKEMVERNGGQIRVTSEVGQGTIVEFTLPLAAVPGEPACSLESSHQHEFFN